MANGIGQLGNIIKDFNESLNQIFGGSQNGDSNKGGLPRGHNGIELFNPELGTAPFETIRANWTGNTIKPNSVRYGFAIMTTSGLAVGNKSDVFYLQIPPKSISQKEIFATNISATRKGVIVETEGVVFKDIVISGNTGIFPGIRASSNIPTANFSDLTAAPKPPTGVDPKTGMSKASGVTTISGYEEFIRLRQYFLRYAAEKVRYDGDRFLIFINEKDGQALVVEPLEFSMDKDASSPLTYNYRIVLKGIGDVASFTFDEKEKDKPLDLFESIGNISANVSAGLGQAGAVINQSRRLVERVSQSLDQTFINPLRQLKFATDDLKDGVSTVLSLPAILARNATKAILDIRQNLGDVAQTVAGRRTLVPKMTPSQKVEEAQRVKTEKVIIEKITADTRVPVSRSAVLDMKVKLKFLADNITDFVGMGDASYDTIKDRIVTNPPGPLKTPTPEELIMIGKLQDSISMINYALATNKLYESDIEKAMEAVAKIYKGIVEVKKPLAVKEIVIFRGDTLEKIALRELGNVKFWPDLVILNKLKAPYISDTGGKGVKKPGQKLLVAQV